MHRELVVDVRRAGAEIAAHGRCDSTSCDLLRTAMQEAVAQGEGDLVLDAAGLEIWGSSTLGVLLGIARRARRADRRLVLTGLGHRELRVVRASPLHRMVVIAIEPDRAAQDPARDPAQDSVAGGGTAGGVTGVPQARLARMPATDPR